MEIVEITLLSWPITVLCAAYAWYRFRFHRSILFPLLLFAVIAAIIIVSKAHRLDEISAAMLGVVIGEIVTRIRERISRN